jgi:hypothetical protein
MTSLFPFGQSFLTVQSSNQVLNIHSMKPLPYYPFLAAASVSVSMQSSLEHWLRILVLAVTLLLGIVKLLRYRRPRGPFVIASAALCLLSLCLLLSGCATSEADLDRFDRFYASSTNFLSALRPAVAVAPTPFNTVFDGVLSAAVLALGTWSGINHRRVSALRNKPSSP